MNIDRNRDIVYSVTNAIIQQYNTSIGWQLNPVIYKYPQHQQPDKKCFLNTLNSTIP